MIQSVGSLQDFLSSYDRSSQSERIQGAALEREQLVRRFPLERWSEMTVEQYALGGHDAWAESFCYWMEFQSMKLGSIRGGSARKLVIYKHKDLPGWYFPKMFKDVETAWEHLRGDFLQAFEHARRGEWDRIDGLETLSWGPAICAKTLHLYFPDEVLPIYSAHHLKHYLKLVGEDESTGGGAGTVTLNRRLHEFLRQIPELNDWSTLERARLLYEWADPRQSRRVVKIAPGHGAEHWDECLAGQYVCVGWDETGDLGDFDSKEAFKERFFELFSDKYRGHKSAMSKKANEVWTLRELEPGDLVVANKGTSEILAIGEVVEPCYRYDESREERKHTATVQWDTSYARKIPPVKRWAMVTVAKVPDKLLETILKGRDEGDGGAGPRAPVDEIYTRVASALERKGQLILYGPPGTGKTYTARRFAVWWLLHRDEHADREAVLQDSTRLAQHEKRLSTTDPGSGQVGRLTRVTFHPSYTYEDFIEGFRPRDTGAGGLELRLEDGIFKRVCRAAQADPTRDYLMLVDEINRGNVAKILGELLTLLELDKRGLTVYLPQSKEMFGIPPNVYVLGTMNTADRSIKLLDAALRRRFAFIELMPDLELLRGATVGDLALDDFLEGLNDRISRAEGREKQIGHAYLLDSGLPVGDAEEFTRRFREEILPLLQEYCYDEYATLATFVGTDLVDAEAQSLDLEKIGDPEQLIAALAAEFGADSDVPEE